VISLHIEAHFVQDSEYVAKTSTSRSEVAVAPIRIDGVEVDGLKVWTVGERRGALEWEVYEAFVDFVEEGLEDGSLEVWESRIEESGEACKGGTRRKKEGRY